MACCCTEAFAVLFVSIVGSNKRASSASFFGFRCNGYLFFLLLLSISGFEAKCDLRLTRFARKLHWRFRDTTMMLLLTCLYLVGRHGMMNKPNSFLSLTK